MEVSPIVSRGKPSKITDQIIERIIEGVNGLSLNLIEDSESWRFPIHVANPTIRIRLLVIVVVIGTL